MQGVYNYRQTLFSAMITRIDSKNRNRSFIVMLLLFTQLHHVFSQIQSYNRAVIWRGFDHKWTYNHRCNRIGDYVIYNNGKPVSTHVSATGIGADSTYFNSCYSYISTPDIVFKEGKIRVTILTKEKQLSDGSVRVTVNCEEWMKNKSNYFSLLNGFDLRSARAADKIQLLRLNIEEPSYDTSSNQLSFLINFSMVLNCQSAECSDVNQKVDYTLDVYYLIAGFNKTDAAVTQGLFTRGYSWDKKEELNEQPDQKILCGSANSLFEEAAIGIKSFSVVLNEAHWILEFHNHIDLLNYNTGSGYADLSVDLLFKEWQEGMKKNSASPKQSEFSAKRSGWAVMDMNVLMMQFQTGDITNGINKGAMFWKGKNKLPQGHDAEFAKPIPLF